MKTTLNNLGNIKQIGPARRKQLKKNGVTNISQLHQLPVEKLARIKFFGKHNASRIKKEVAAYVAKHLLKPTKKNKTNKPPAGLSVKKTLKILSKRIARADEKLKPLWEKKYLKPYLGFKKNAKKLSRLIKAISKQTDTVSKKDKKKIIEQTNALIIILETAGKKPKKKGFKKITTGIKVYFNSIKKYKL